MPIHVEAFPSGSSNDDTTTLSPGFLTNAGVIFGATKSTAGASTGLFNGIGMFTSSDAYLSQVYSANGQSTPACESRTLLKAGGYGDTGTTREHCIVDSITSSNVVLKWDNAASSAWLYSVMLFGGLLDQDLQEGTSSANGTVTQNLGWDSPPDLLIMMTCWTASEAASTEVHGHLGLSFLSWDGSSESQYGVSMASENFGSATNSDTTRTLDLNGFSIRSLDPSGRDNDFTLTAHVDPALTSIDGGYTIVTTNHDGTGTCRYQVLALRGLNAAVVDADAPTAVASSNAIGPAVRFVPSACMTMNNQTTSEGNTTHACISLSMLDKLTTRGLWGRDKDNVSSTATERRWHESLSWVESPSTSANKFASTLGGFCHGGLTEEPSAVDTAYKRGFLFLGDRNAPASRQRNINNRRQRLSHLA